MTGKDLMVVFAASNFSFVTNLEGVTHEESIWQPEAGGNSINWIAGHLLHTRQRILTTALTDRQISEDDLSMYANTGVFDLAAARPIEQIASEMDAAFKAMTRAILKLNGDQLEEVLPEPFRGQTVTRGQMLNLFQFHEAYHAGQIGILRRLLGKEGKIGPVKK